MKFYCPNCWSFVEEGEKICHKCRAEIEHLDQRGFFEKVINALNHSERTTRIRAAYILGELRDKRAIAPLRDVIDKTDDLFLIEGIALALGKIDGKEVLPTLIRLMDHASFLVRRAALNSLSNFQNERALKVIKKALKDPSLNVQELARKILQVR